MTNMDYVSYPGGLYNGDTLTAMANLGMRTGRTLQSFNIIAPITSPYEIPDKEIGTSASLNTVQGWVDRARTRQEILVFTLYGLGTSPSSPDWYVDRFQSLVNYCIQQGIPIFTMDDLYRLQSSDITIPGAK